MGELDAESARDLLRTMWRIRLFEERVAQLKRTLQVHGLIHLSIGGEGVAAAVCGQLRNDDAVYSGHRAHGHAIAKGAPLDRVMAELMGRDTGLCRGLGGSMHLVDAEHGFMGATGVVGGDRLIADGDQRPADPPRADDGHGAARHLVAEPRQVRMPARPAVLAHHLLGGDRVSVVFFGDGAVQAGHFNESINLAALWRLPVIFVCENNGFAEFTSRDEHSTIERVSDVVAPYGFERETVEGSDPAAVYEAFGRMLGSARGGAGPFLLECLTFRRRGHYEGDQQKYRDDAAEEEWARRDPIARLTEAMLPASVRPVGDGRS